MGNSCKQRRMKSEEKIEKLPNHDFQSGNYFEVKP